MGGAAAIISMEDSTERSEKLERGRIECFELLVIFVYIVAPQIFLNPFLQFVRSRWVLKWRQQLTIAYLHHMNILNEIEGISQRIQEDTFRFANGVSGVLFLTLETSLTLITFSPLLYKLSYTIPAPRNDLPRSWLLLLSYFLSLVGIAFTFLISKPLVAIEIQNQKIEAEFRKLLVLCELNQTSVPAVPETELRSSLTGVIRNYKLLYFKLSHVNFFLGLYEQLVVILPYILVAPLLFDPKSGVTMGVLMQVTDAFGRITGALAKLAEALPALNDFRSVRIRLLRIEASIKPTDSTRLVSDVELEEVNDEKSTHAHD